MNEPRNTFKPLWWLLGAHSETVYAKLRQPPLPDYRRELHLDSSGQTQVAYDFIDAGDTHAPLVVLFTGLEGSSSSHYARALMEAVQKRGWHGVVAHYRGCGGVENTAPLTYHAGDSHEVAFVLAELAKQYHTIYAVGVSLGGNMLARYLGEQKNAVLPCAAAVLSAPLDLAVSAESINSSLIASALYNPYFMRPMCQKARAVATRFPELGLDRELHCKTLPEFDAAVTVPLYGFNDVADYYARCSALSVLPQITVPTLILNAKNDPFLAASALPDQAQVSDAVALCQPDHGGHIGFVSGRGLGHIDWVPETVLTFFNKIQRNMDE
ncbi:alpha/beta fold hydrolase [Cardiobacteriaceae bacterium TAE3-ERU3]|nr:alpha/beta fold hydrolase [Cardiobacteriaceae bacterium TAE3-ERU3]